MGDFESVMNFTLPPQPSGRSIVILYLIIMSVWVSLMAAGLTGRGCRNPIYNESKRLGYCNLSLGITHIASGALEGHKASSLYMERGILFANAGKLQDARRDMQHALELASFGQPRTKLLELLNPPKTSPIIRNPSKPDPWVPWLIVRAEQRDASELAKQIWFEVLTEALNDNES